MSYLQKLLSADSVKFNPSQPDIAEAEGDQASRENVYNYRKQYESLELLNRGVNMIVDDCSAIDCVVGARLKKLKLSAKVLHRLLNVEPNPYQDISTFRTNLFIDYLLDGNMFIYFDGRHIYHLPANKMVIVPDPKEYVKYYTFNDEQDYAPSEVIHIKDNSFYSIYRGISRLKPASRSMELLGSMRSFQDNFFGNGAVPGLIVKTPNILSDKIKTRLLESWAQRYNPKSGGRRPMILDGGLEIDSISDVDFKDLDFENSIARSEQTVLKALGVPPILLEGGNNANIRPNHRLFYLETILPIVRKLNTGLSNFFGLTITAELTGVPALQPELNDKASYVSTLVNGGVLTVNEGRAELGKEPLEGGNNIRIPANIAGSAGNPSEGGRPTEGED